MSLPRPHLPPILLLPSAHLPPTFLPQGALHERGLAHCDLKPQNVMISHDVGFDRKPRLRLSLIDLGMATALGGVQGGGTYDFMIPTDLAKPGLFQVGPTRDTYALGGIIYKVRHIHPNHDKMVKHHAPIIHS